MINLKTYLKIFGLLLLMFTTLVSCSTTTSQVDTARWKPNLADRKEVSLANRSRAITKPVVLDSRRLELVESAKKYLGTPYKYGGNDPKGFDCSGFTSRVFQEHGYSVNGPSYMQAKLGTTKSTDEALPGDLLVFRKPNGKVFHVALVTEVSPDELWVAHSTSSRGVVLSNVLDSDYWKSKMDRIQDVISN